MRRWRPDALYLWSGKTIAWLIAEVLYRAAGLSCHFDGEPGWETVVDRFALVPSHWEEALTGPRRDWLHRDSRAHAASARDEVVGETGLGAVRTLLAKVSGWARWQADGSLYCFVPAVQDLHDPYLMGTAGEVIDALMGHGLIFPTQVRAFGEGVACVAAAPDSLGSPRRYLATCVDPQARSEGECARRARGLAHNGQARRHVGWVETPCQCGLDLYDLVAIDDPQGPASPTDYLRIVGLVERYSPSEGLFTTRATYEGA